MGERGPVKASVVLSWVAFALFLRHTWVAWDDQTWTFGSNQRGQQTEGRPWLAALLTVLVFLYAVGVSVWAAERQQRRRRH